MKDVLIENGLITAEIKGNKIFITDSINNFKISLYTYYIENFISFLEHIESDACCDIPDDDEDDYGFGGVDYEDIDTSDLDFAIEGNYLADGRAYRILEILDEVKKHLDEYDMMSLKDLCITYKENKNE